MDNLSSYMGYILEETPMTRKDLEKMIIQTSLSEEQKLYVLSLIDLAFELGKKDYETNNKR